MRMGLRYKKLREQRKKKEIYQRYNASKWRWELVDATTGKLLEIKTDAGAYEGIPKEVK
ncbi:MAG: hypothetical protein OXR68_00270 [Alphaproteobacteria bacterium]|nr:hypothetical protein [Alphaproteobacteria bacterium]MDD9919046.1 hypothetical protein [Alphaproteobacteria bacterium]